MVMRRLCALGQGSMDIHTSVCWPFDNFQGMGGSRGQMGGWEVRQWERGRGLECPSPSSPLALLLFADWQVTQNC